MTPVHLERREPPAGHGPLLCGERAINLVGRDRSSKASIRAKRKRAAWNDGYMLQLLAS